MLFREKLIERSTWFFRERKERSFPAAERQSRRQRRFFRCFFLRQHVFSGTAAGEGSRKSRERGQGITAGHAPAAAEAVHGGILPVFFGAAKQKRGKGGRHREGTGRGRLRAGMAASFFRAFPAYGGSVCSACCGRKKKSPAKLNLRGLEWRSGWDLNPRPPA